MPKEKKKTGKWFSFFFPCHSHFNVKRTRAFSDIIISSLLYMSNYKCSRKKNVYKKRKEKNFQRNIFFFFRKRCFDMFKIISASEITEIGLVLYSSCMKVCLSFLIFEKKIIPITQTTNFRAVCSFFCSIFNKCIGISVYSPHREYDLVIIFVDFFFSYFFPL